jgi:hypothetical protein
LEGLYKWANVMAAWRVMSGLLRLVAKLARVPKPALSWRLTQRPTFDNALATVQVDGRKVTVHWQICATETSMTKVGEAALN